MVEEREQLWLVSVDDHVIEPGHVWTSNVPAKYREAAPTLVQDDIGWAWRFEGRRQPMTGLAAVAGTPRETWSPAELDFGGLDPAYNTPEARAAAMTADGILASVCFPSYPRFCGQTFLEATDKDLALACVRAYNDWMIDEWCASAPGRFIPLVLPVLWDPELAAGEVRRCASKGARSVAFSENPTKLGLPSLYDTNGHWDPFFAACAETGLPLSIHIGSSSQMIQTAPDAPIIVGLALIQQLAMQAFTDWLYSGKLLQFPELKVCLSEGGVAWMPYLIQWINHVNEVEEWATKVKVQGDLLQGETSVTVDRGEMQAFDALEIFHRQIFGCQLPNESGWEALDYLGYDNVMVETDYPHSAASYPESRQWATKALGHLTAEDRHKVIAGNACRIYNFTPVDPASLAS